MATNVLANGVEIEGVLEFSGDMELNCKVVGEVISSQGSLILNKESDVKGDVKAADVKGDVSYKTLEVKPGAKLVGSMKIIA